MKVSNMEYANPDCTNRHISYSLEDWCFLVSTAIENIKSYKEIYSYAVAVNTAKELLAYLKGRVKNFAERSFVAKLAPYIDPKDLYSHPVTE
jgi:hypothetical protein